MYIYNALYKKIFVGVNNGLISQAHMAFVSNITTAACLPYANSELW